MKFERVDGGLQASVVKKPKSRKFFVRAGVDFIRLSSKECRELPYCVLETPSFLTAFALGQ